MRLATFAALILAGCDLVDPQLPSNALQFSPPTVYSRWWTMVESCSGMSRPMQRVAFYVVPGAHNLPGQYGRDVVGYWSKASDRIVLAGRRQFDGSLVRHEMLHALLQRGGHPRESFLRQCAGVVGCGLDCIDDSEPPRALDPTTPRVTADALNLGVQISPPTPGPAEDEGFFILTVTARNSAAHPVFVVLRPREGTLGSTFSLDLRGPAGGLTQGQLAVDVETMMFAAGETKRYVYDFRVGPNDPINRIFPPGQYTARAGYDHVWAAEVQSFTIVP